MTAQDFRPDDRETLSALFDGELDTEARRFAQRRLAHDADWQRDCGRWQLIGDALRRQAPIAAPVDFADRVAVALAAEQATAVAAPVAASRTAVGSGSRARWFGGALAASVALVAAVSALRPGVEPAAAPSNPVADRSTPAAPAAASPLQVQAAASPVQVQAAIAAGPTAPISLAAALPDPSRRPQVDREPAPRSTAPRRVASVQRVPASMPVASTETRVAASFLPDASANPFNLGTDAPLTARPWPRAGLPTAEAAFTASYGAAGESAGQRPSFYPFEPRLPAAAEPAPSP